MYKIDYLKYKFDCKQLANLIKEKNKDITSLFGIKRGGFIVAQSLEYLLNLPIVKNLSENTLIVDDLIDSGKTLKEYIDNGYNTAVLYRKPHSPTTTYFVEEINDWIEFFYENTEKDNENNIIRILEYIGENPNREGLKDTPKRIIEMYKEIFKGYDKQKKPEITIFANGIDGIMYDQMIFDTGKFYSFCEHHILPFFGTYYFAYVPKDKLIGLSKVARIIDYYSSKLQIQERLVKEIIDELSNALNPLGIALVLKAKHLCKELRGIKNEGKMITSDLRGVFREKLETREEFINLISK